MLIPGLRLRGQANCDLVASEAPTERFIEWRLQAPQAPLLHERAPLNLAVVIDRSGSMAGEKLAYAKRAAVHLLSALGPQDRLAVVAYDDQVSVLAPSERVEGGRREAMTSAIHGLAPGGSTDLGGGWLHGAQQVAEQLLDEGVNRTLLLSDGLANVGITAPEELAAHARELRERRISTSTFGVGLDFNEHLLGAMAEKGGGHFYFIQRPEQIPDFFRRELGELQTVVARGAALVFSGPDTAAVEVLGALPFEYDGSRLHVPLGDLFSAEERYIYLRVLTAPAPTRERLPIRASLRYRDLSGEAQTAEAAVSFTYVGEAQAEAAPHDVALEGRMAEVRLAGAAHEALRLSRDGRHREAGDVLEAALAANDRLAAPAVLRDYDDLAQRLRSGGLSVRDSKQRHFAEYRKRTSRK
jgi:Ca-activated chloride channel family protein